MRYLAGRGIVLITLLSVLSHIAWNPYLELTSHFKVQYLVVCLLLLVFPLLQRNQRWLIVSLFCLSIQATEILPWYVGIPQTSSSPPNLRILLSNVYVRNQSYDQVLSLVRQENPDVAVFQEVSYVWAKELRSLSSQFPYSFQAPDDLAVYSRLPLENPTLFGSPNQHSISMELTIKDQPVQIIVTHPPPPMPHLFNQRNSELAQVADYIKQQKKATVLIGDLNITMWSPYYKQLIKKTQLKNTRQGFGLLPTWPAPTKYAKPYSPVTFLKPILWVPIDHCLVSPTIHVKSTRTGSNINSDHLPLITDLVVPNKT